MGGKGTARGKEGALRPTGVLVENRRVRGNMRCLDRTPMVSSPQAGALRARNFLRMYCVSLSTESTSTRMSLKVGRSLGLKARHLVPSTCV